MLARELELPGRLELGAAKLGALQGRSGPSVLPVQSLVEQAAQRSVPKSSESTRTCASPRANFIALPSRLALKRLLCAHTDRDADTSGCLRLQLRP